MNKFRMCLLGLTAIGGLFLAGSQAFAAGVGNTIGVRLLGSDVAYAGDTLFNAYGVGGPASLCWDFAIHDIKTGDVIGDVTDCAEVTPVANDGFEVIGTTFFYFPGGTVVTRVTTTVQPVLHGSPDYTHITGAIPQAGDNNVIYGDGKFKNAEGPVRLSGAVDLTNFLATGEITIDCLFTLDIGS